jgi:dolichol-phosphate mannosyltransferase/undecaprenyl-phosphate 4-deoxy-4-formamido-L-arabinose transferase
MLSENNRIDYSVVIPVYNTTTVLKELSTQLIDFFLSIDVDDFEIIFVNDSPYNQSTCDALNECLALDLRIKVITLSKNFGQQAATICGFEFSRGEYIITMDDDLQHSPKDIINLINNKEHDIVIACLKDKKHSFIKRQFSKIKNHFDHVILRKPKNIKMSSFRLISRLVADKVVELKTPYPFIPALLFQVSLDVVNPEVTHYERFEGESGYNFSSMVKLFSNLMINNSSYLLKLIGRLGALSFVSSLIYAVYLVINKMLDTVAISGWTSIMVLITLFGGGILFSIGIVGEYLIRIIHSSEGRPAYIVKEDR